MHNHMRDFKDTPSRTEQEDAGPTLWDFIGAILFMVMVFALCCIGGN